MEKEFIMIMEIMSNNAILANGSEWIWICIVAVIIILVIIAIGRSGGGGGYYGGGCSNCGSSGGSRLMDLPRLGVWAGTFPCGSSGQKSGFILGCFRHEF